METTPSFMYPYGTSSNQIVLRGVDLLLECIASGVYVPLAPGGRGNGFWHLLICSALGSKQTVQSLMLHFCYSLQ